MKEKVSTALAEKYDSLPAKDQTSIRDKIILQCGITKTTFYRWLEGDNVKKPYRSIIASALNCQVEDIFESL